MTKLKAIIVDDERLARVNLKKLLESHPEIEIIGEADSCDKTLEIIHKCTPDIIFLDIQLNGETGFDLLERIDNTIRVIFVTAFDDFAIRAFEVNATDYLLKPVNPERLKLAIGRIIDKNPEEKPVTRKFDYSDSIYIKLSNYKSSFIKIGYIISIESVGNYSKILSRDKKTCLILKTIKQWEEELPPQNFKRIHRARIINIEYINRIEKSSSGYHKVYLTHIDEPLEISRRFASKLKM